jgi:RNA polymerase sigma factor (sigma-70 family)
MSTRSDIEKLCHSDYNSMVKRISFRAGGIPNAEDVVQEAFARALKYSGTFDPAKKEIGAWFNMIMNNALRDFKRQQRMEGMTDEDETTDSLDNTVYQEEMIRLTEEEMDSRGEDVAEALRYHIVMGYTIKEVAELVAMTPFVVKNHVQSFRKYMRGRYGEGVCS